MKKGTNSKGISTYEKDGKVFYKVNTTFRTKDNQPYKKGKQGFKSLREAQQWKLHMQLEIEEKTLYELDNSKTAINAAIQEYLKFREGQVKFKTLYEIGSRLKLLSQAMGNIRFNEIKVAHIEQFYKKVLDSYDKVSTINSIISTTLGFVDWLELVEYIDRTVHNKFHLILQPKKVVPNLDKNTFYEMEQVRAILDTFDTSIYEEKKYKLFFTMLFFSGMRRGEGLAIKYSDIDYINNTISVTKQYQEKKKERKSDKGYVISPYTKTNVNKKVQVPSWLIEMFLEAYQIDGMNADEFVFIERKMAFSPTSVAKVFKDHCGVANVPVKKLHATRHTYTTMLIDMGANMKFAQKQLGHLTEVTTKNVYDHITEQRKRQGVDIIESIQAI